MSTKAISIILPIGIIIKSSSETVFLYFPLQNIEAYFHISYYFESAKYKNSKNSIVLNF